MIGSKLQGKTRKSEQVFERGCDTFVGKYILIAHLEIVDLLICLLPMIIKCITKNMHLVNNV